MAKDLRYRPLGVGIPSVPTVDFVATGAAQARNYNAIAKSLDSMNEYLYKKQVKITEREAAQYAFENPVTAEQIQDAISQGRDIEEIVGDPDTVFGAVTSATIAQQLTTELEINASKKVAAYSAAIKSGGLYTNEQIGAMRADLTAMITGHSETIAAIDPNQALKYNAAANVSASSVYKSALEMKLSVEKAVKVAAAEEFLAGLPNEFADNLTSKDKDFKTALGDLEIMARKAKDVVISTGDLKYANRKFPEIEKMLKDVQVGVLIDAAFDESFADNDAKRISRVRKNDFGEKSELFNMLSPSVQATIRTGIRERIDARLKDDTIQEKILDDDSATSFSVLAEDFRNSTSAQEQERLIADMFEVARTTNNRVVNPTTINGLISAKRSAEKAQEEPTKNPIGVGTLKVEIYQDKIQTIPQLQARALQLDVTIEEWSGLITTIEKNKNDDYKLGLKEINRAAKIYPGSGQAPTQKQIDKQINYEKKMDTEFEAQLTEWEGGGMIGPRPSYVNIAKKITKDAQESKFQTAINNKFTSYKTDFPSLSAYFTEQKFEDLEDILNDTDLLKDFGLSKKQINRLRANYLVDVDFLNEQISGRDGL
jgi:ribosomal protein L9